jgi:hypothetical protein
MRLPSIGGNSALFLTWTMAYGLLRSLHERVEKLAREEAAWL